MFRAAAAVFCCTSKIERFRHSVLTERNSRANLSQLSKTWSTLRQPSTERLRPHRTGASSSFALPQRVRISSNGLTEKEILSEHWECRVNISSLAFLRTARGSHIHGPMKAGIGTSGTWKSLAVYQRG